MGDPLTWLVVAAIYTGLLLATGIVATVIYDLTALQKGWRSVSGDVLILGRRFPVAALLITGIFCFIGGVLIGHLFFPQIVQVVP